MDDTRQRYQRIHDQLSAAINSGHLPRGLVLVEGPVAEIFGTSRAPVRKAFEMLHASGLLATFEGRGYLVAGERIKRNLTPLRLPLTSELLGLGGFAPQEPLSVTDRVFAVLEATVSMAIIFGHFRIDENEAAETLGVARSTVRDALGRLSALGLVEKSPYSHWLCGPVTAAALSQDYELRMLLEPQALAESGPKIPQSEVLSAVDDVKQVISGHSEPTLQLLDRIEATLHVELLRKAKNTKLLRMIESVHTPLAFNHTFYESFSVAPDQKPFVEHGRVLKAMASRDFSAAGLALKEHLNAARNRTLQRLKSFALLPNTNLPTYMRRVS